MSSLNLICDVCGREVMGCTFVNGMRFCAKCYQETFGGSKDWRLLDKENKISDLETKLAQAKMNESFEKEKKENAWEFIEELKQQLAEREEKIKAIETLREMVNEDSKLNFKRYIDILAKNEQLEHQLAEKERDFDLLMLSKNEEINEWIAVRDDKNKVIDKQTEKINELKQQLAVTEKALKLAREYMFNVMCADDVPFESWFIECAKNDWKPS